MEATLETQHTPGPWKFSPNGAGYLVTREDVFVVGHGICGVKPSQSASEDQCEANARLIAAAPDMLAVLNETTLQLRYLADKFGETGTGAAVLARVQAVIAKAEGNEPA